MTPVERQRSLLLVLNFAVSIDGFLPEGRFSFFLVSVSMLLTGVIPTISDNNSLPPPYKKTFAYKNRKKI